MVLARNAFLRKRAAVLRIQAAYRGHTARSVAADLRYGVESSPFASGSSKLWNLRHSEAAEVRAAVPQMWQFALIRQHHVLLVWSWELPDVRVTSTQEQCVCCSDANANAACRQHRAALQIQAAWRGRLARRKYLATRRGVVALQVQSPP